MSNRLELFELLGALGRRRFNAGERAFSSLGLNHTEARLLTILDREGGEATQDVLSSSLFVDRSNAGRALKRLEERRFIVRQKDEADSRTNLVQMTDAGAEVVLGVSQLRGELAQSFFSELSEADAGKIVELLGETFGAGEDRTQGR